MEQTCSVFALPPLAFERGFEGALERGKIFRDRPARRALHGAVALNELDAELRYRGRPSAAAAQRGAHDRPSELRVHTVNEDPRRAIRHSHQARRLADGAAVAYQLENLDLPGTKGTVGTQVQAEQHACHGDLASRRLPSGQSRGN